MATTYGVGVLLAIAIPLAVVTLVAILAVIYFTVRYMAATTKLNRAVLAASRADIETGMVAREKLAADTYDHPKTPNIGASSPHQVQTDRLQGTQVSKAAVSSDQAAPALGDPLDYTTSIKAPRVSLNLDANRLSSALQQAYRQQIGPIPEDRVDSTPLDVGRSNSSSNSKPKRHNSRRQKTQIQTQSQSQTQGPVDSRTDILTDARTAPDSSSRGAATGTSSDRKPRQDTLPLKLTTTEIDASQLEDVPLPSADRQADGFDADSGVTIPKTPALALTREGARKSASRKVPRKEVETRPFTMEYLQTDVEPTSPYSLMQDFEDGRDFLEPPVLQDSRRKVSNHLRQPTATSFAGSFGAASSAASIINDPPSPPRHPVPRDDTQPHSKAPEVKQEPSRSGDLRRSVEVYGRSRPPSPPEERADPSEKRYLSRPAVLSHKEVGRDPQTQVVVQTSAQTQKVSSSSSSQRPQPPQQQQQSTSNVMMPSQPQPQSQLRAPQQERTQQLAQQSPKIPRELSHASEQEQIPLQVQSEDESGSHNDHARQAHTLLAPAWRQTGDTATGESDAHSKDDPSSALSSEEPTSASGQVDHSQSQSQSDSSPSGPSSAFAATPAQLSSIQEQSVSTASASSEYEEAGPAISKAAATTTPGGTSSSHEPESQDSDLRYEQALVPSDDLGVSGESTDVAALAKPPALAAIGSSAQARSRSRSADSTKSFMTAPSSINAAPDAASVLRGRIHETGRRSRASSPGASSRSSSLSFVDRSATGGRHSSPLIPKHPIEAPSSPSQKWTHQAVSGHSISPLAIKSSERSEGLSKKTMAATSKSSSGHRSGRSGSGSGSGSGLGSGLHRAPKSESSKSVHSKLVKSAEMNKPLPQPPMLQTWSESSLINSPASPRRPSDGGAASPEYLRLAESSPSQFASPVAHAKDSEPSDTVLSTSEVLSEDDGVVANLLGTKYRVVFPYRPQLGDELELTVGQVIRIYQVFDDGWCFGRHKLGDSRYVQGICPKSCLTPF